MRRLLRYFSKTIAFALFTIIAAVAVSPLAAYFVDDAGSSNLVFLAMAFTMALLCFLASDGRRAWGWGSLVSGLTFFALPLSTLLLASDLSNDLIQEAADPDRSAAAVGATVGAGLLFGASAILGLIVGAILTIIGIALLLGGRREVVIVGQEGGKKK
jgi:hypothetical protein